MLSTNHIYTTLQHAVNLSADIKNEKKVYDLCTKFGTKAQVDWNEISNQISKEIVDAKKLQNDGVLSSFIRKHIIILNELKEYASLQNTSDNSVWAKRFFDISLATPIRWLCLKQLLRATTSSFFDFSYKSNDYLRLFFLFSLSTLSFPISFHLEKFAKRAKELKESQKDLTIESVKTSLPTSFFSTKSDVSSVKLQDLADSNLKEINEISKKYDLKEVQIPLDKLDDRYTSDLNSVPCLNDAFYLQRFGEIALYAKKTPPNELLKRVRYGVLTSVVSSLLLYILYSSKSCAEKAGNYFGKEKLENAFSHFGSYNINDLTNRMMYNNYIDKCNSKGVQGLCFSALGLIGGILYTAINAAALFHKTFYTRKRLLETVLEKKL